MPESVYIEIGPNLKEVLMKVADETADKYNIIFQFKDLLVEAIRASIQKGGLE